jgi:hypothetical protein
VLPFDDPAARETKKPLAITPAAQAGFENGSGNQMSPAPVAQL